jgi:hypothetical protein
MLPWLVNQMAAARISAFSLSFQPQEVQTTVVPR